MRSPYFRTRYLMPLFPPLAIFQSKLNSKSPNSFRVMMCPARKTPRLRKISPPFASQPERTAWPSSVIHPSSDSPLKTLESSSNAPSEILGNKLPWIAASKAADRNSRRGGRKFGWTLIASSLGASITFEKNLYPTTNDSPNPRHFPIF